jgi:hypothetical protein
LYSFGTFFPVLVSCIKKNLATLLITYHICKSELCWQMSRVGQPMSKILKNAHEPELGFFKATTLLPWRDSISRLIAPISSVAGGDATTRHRRQVRFRFTGYHMSQKWAYRLYLNSDLCSQVPM